MTNNQALITQTGSEAVWVSRSDGWGIQELRKAGIRQVILSTEKNPVVASRAKKLKIGVVQGSRDKAKSIRKICRANGVMCQDVLFVGNDVNDLPAMRLAGVSASPADGHPEVLKYCRHITKAKGGEGVIREIADLILSGRTSKTIRR
jgi:YrbI family 3-deoxy-D-manno-octulosonate 8-phosphate phosphatase